MYVLNISSELMEKLWQCIGGLICAWVNKNGLKASALTHKFSILHKIGRQNWIPTTNHSKVTTELVNYCIEWVQRVL